MVLTLSGVLKDILLVVASTLIFHDPVTGIQIGGYGVALSGLIYYKLGAEKMKEYFGQGTKSIANYRQTHPALAKLIMFGIFVFFIIVVMGGLFSFAPSEYTSSAQARVNSLWGDKTQS